MVCPSQPGLFRAFAAGFADRWRLADLNQAAVWAALTAWCWYAFGLLPLQLALIDEAKLDPDRASSAIAIAWVSAAVVTISLSLLYRQPIAFAVPSVALIFVQAVAGSLPFAEIL